MSSLNPEGGKTWRLNQGNSQHSKLEKQEGGWAQLDSWPGVGAGPKMKGFSHPVTPCRAPLFLAVHTGTWRRKHCSESGWPGWLVWLSIQVVQVFGQTGRVVSWEAQEDVPEA